MQSEIVPVQTLVTSPIHMMSTSLQSTDSISSGTVTHSTAVSESRYHSLDTSLTYSPTVRMTPHTIRESTQPTVNYTTVPSSSASSEILSQVNTVATPQSIPSQAALLSAVPTTPLSVHSALSSTIISLLSQAISGTSSSISSPPQATPSVQPATIDSKYLFWVTLVCGNISRCQGCANKILRDANGKPLPPPDDIVLQHKEQVLFNNPNTGLFQLSKDYRNVYYHARKSCVCRKYPTFQPILHCRINGQTLQVLKQTHLDYLAKEFGIKFSQRPG